MNRLDDMNSWRMFCEIVRAEGLNAACERLGRRLAEHMLAEVYERLLDRYAASPQQRYEALTERCPDVLQLVPLRELASYLGVRPETLSRIRRRVR